MSEPDRYEVYVRVSDSDDDQYLYIVEHWFSYRPDEGSLKGLLDEATGTFNRLYPEIEADDFSVELRRLRPRDTGTDQAAATAGTG